MDYGFFGEIGKFENKNPNKQQTNGFLNLIFLRKISLRWWSDAVQDQKATTINHEFRLIMIDWMNKWIRHYFGSNKIKTKI